MDKRCLPRVLGTLPASRRGLYHEGGDSGQSEGARSPDPSAFQSPDMLWPLPAAAIAAPVAHLCCAPTRETVAPRVKSAYLLSLVFRERVLLLSQAFFIELLWLLITKAIFMQTGS